MPSQNSKPSPVSLLVHAQRLKQADRARQSELSPEQGQRQAEIILDPAAWVVADVKELSWPGDLADPPEDPLWMQGE